MKDDGEGLEAGGRDGPAAAEQLDGMIVGSAALEMEGEVEVAERRRRHGFELGALLLEGELPGVVRGEAGGAAGVMGIVPGDLDGEQGVGGREVGDALGAQQGAEAVLESAEATLDLAFCLRVRGDAVGDAEAEERALELGADIIGAGVRGGAEEGKAVGVIGARSAVGGPRVR